MEKTMSQAKLKVIDNNMMDKDNRGKSLEAAVSLIEKNYGKGSIMKLGSKTNVDIESISTGSLGLDIALGIGGVQKGRIYPAGFADTKPVAGGKSVDSRQKNRRVEITILNQGA